jgi:hypothetical protein
VTLAANVHKISGSEAWGRPDLMPGYAALKIGETRPFQWGWRHTLMTAGALVASLTILGVNGFLP